MKYLDLLFLGLKLLHSFTAWMERKEFIALGEAQQIKANLEASQDVLNKMLKARADSAARRAAGGVRDDEPDPDNRDRD